MVETALSYWRERTVVAVDEDVELFDERSVPWAISTRVQWHRDTIEVDSLSQGNRVGIARRLQLPSKLMPQHKFGSRRRAMLSFQRQPFPGTCHVDQDVAHSQAWRALGHFTTFDRMLSALHRRNHLSLPPDLAPG
ncbi:MAG: hypothetical protein ACXWCH_35355 [Burkholderiales bacterium]